MEGINENVDSERQVLSRKSWVAYVQPLLILFVIFLISINFHFMLGIIPASLAVLAILSIRSVELYIDGVWIYSGIFPWNKGSSGVKWRDLDEAVFFTGFFSWALKSYTLKISHRFTKDSEIILSNMKAGDLVVPLINEQHKISINKVAEA